MSQQEESSGIGTLYVSGPEGKPIPCDILFTFSGETGKDYIVYTDNTRDEQGNVRVYASTYDPRARRGTLGEITTEEEWSVVRRLLDRLQGMLREAADAGIDLDQETIIRRIQEEFGGGDE